MTADVLIFAPNDKRAKVAIMTRTRRKTHDPNAAPNRVRELRKERGLTLEAVAHVVGTSIGNLAKIERGLRDLNQQWMVRIADALDVEPADLLMPEDGGLTTDERALIDTLRGIPAAMRQSYFALRESHQPYIGSPEIVPLRSPSDAADDGATEIEDRRTA